LASGFMYYLIVRIYSRIKFSMEDHGQFFLPTRNSTKEERISYYYSEPKTKVYLTSPKLGMLEMLMKEIGKKTNVPTTINKVIKDEFKRM